MNDEATNLPSNNCNDCDKEVLGYVDNPEETFICEECKKPMIDLSAPIKTDLWIACSNLIEHGSINNNW